ncbi:MAG: hypothetical protein NTY57_01535 [Solirubrobacterales bacterium]|nr:hypothetical protein [Solirubrobacterales bacterium]
MWNFILWVHLVAMAFFVGGQLMLAVAVVPVLKGKDDGEPMRAVARKFGCGTLVALAVLIASGLAMAIHEHVFTNKALATEFNAKMGLIALVGVLIIVHLRKPKLHALDALIFIGSLTIVWLGVSISSQLP